MSLRGTWRGAGGCTWAFDGSRCTVTVDGKLAARAAYKADASTLLFSDASASQTFDLLAQTSPLRWSVGDRGGSLTISYDGTPLMPRTIVPLVLPTAVCLYRE